MLRKMTLFVLILLGTSPLFSQDSSSVVVITCPADISITANDSMGNTLWVDVPEAVASSPVGEVTIVNDYNDGGANASDFYDVNATTAVLFVATDPDGNGAICATLISINLGGGDDSTDVYGCMDPAALNYNPLATIDDGSCIYDDSLIVPTIVCPADIYISETDSSENTLWVDVPEVVASSPTGIASITNSYNNGGANASDFYPVNETTPVTFTATDINGNAVSCQTLISIFIGEDSTDVYGCMDPEALNYNPFATIDDGSCIYDNDSTGIWLVCPDDVSIFEVNPTGEPVYVDLPPAIAYGGIEPYTYLNDYNFGGADASDFYPAGTTIVTFTASDANGDASSCSTEIYIYYNDSINILGCMDPGALNYNPFATIDDGSCVYDGDDSIPGCTAIAAFQFTQIDPANNFVEISNTSVWEGDAIFFWEFGDGTTSDEPYPDHVYDQDGVYFVCLKLMVQNNGVVCEDTYCDSIGLFGGNKSLDSGFSLNVIPSIITGIDETASLFNEGLNLYPNPASGILNLDYSLNSNADVNITIYDVSGRVVDFQLSFNRTGRNHETIDVSELQPGMYMLELNANQKDKIVSRFIINR